MDTNATNGQGIDSRGSLPGRAPDGYSQDDRRRPHPDVIAISHQRGLFEQESLEVTLEGRIALMTALAARIREVCAGLQNHPRVRDMGHEDKEDLRQAVDHATALSLSLTNFTGALLEQEPTREGRERGVRGRVMARGGGDGRR